MRTYVLRTLAVIELLLAAFFTFMGLGFALDPGQRIGGDGILTGFAPAFAALFLGAGLMLGWSAILAWRDDRRWWKLLLAAPLLVPAVFLVTAIIAGILAA